MTGVSAKLARVAAGVLLLEERKANKAIRDAIAGRISQAAAEAEDKRRKRAEMMTAILFFGSRMAHDAATAIKRSRAGARDAARGRLSHELGLAISVLLDVKPERRALDDASAQQSGQSLANQWQGIAIASALSADRRDLSVSVSIRRTEKLMSKRVARTAATEVARAYSDEHLEAANDAAEAEIIVRPDWSRVWSAILDMRACQECAAHHGETVLLGESFSGGDEPGDMHPLCRCIDIVVPTAEANRIAA